MDENNIDNESLENSYNNTRNQSNNKQKLVNGASNGMRVAGKSASLAGNGMKYAGKGMSLAGKGISAAGNSLSAAGKGISATGVGAVVGVPLSVLGSIGSGLGKATEVAGKGLDKAGEGVKKAGKSLDKAGKNIKKTNNSLKVDVNIVKNINKYKFIIAAIAIVVFIIILFIFLIMVLDALKLISSESSGSSTVTYSTLTEDVTGSNNENLWFPIGSSEVTTSIDIDGNKVEFRSGTPVSTGISSGYKTPERPKHAALDITAGGDVYLIAMADGVVTYVKCGTKEKPCTRDTGYNTYGGNSNACTSEGELSIAIKYNNGYESKYLHLENSSIPEFLQDGSKVYQGQVVGKMGNTGCSDGQHLHLALLVNNQAVNPENFVTSSSPRSLPDGVTKRSEEILKEAYDRQKEQEESLTEENIVGNDNKQKVCFALKNYYSDNVVAGIMVNVEKESSFDPTNSYMEYDGYPSAGLFQWHKGRLNLLKSMYGNEWTLISNQIEYFRYEISTTEDETAPILSNTSLSVSEVAYQFCKTFERAKDCSPRKNQTIANKYENYVKNGCE